MSKKIYMFLLCAMMLTLVACGKENNTSDVENENQQITDVVTEDVEEESAKDNNADVLLGVYEGATDYANVPMGMLFDGEQKVFCKIKMPDQYLFNAVYTEDGETDVTNDTLSGILLGDVKSELDKQEMASKWVYVMSTGGTTVNFYIIPTTERNLEDEKAYAGEYKEQNHNGHEAIYFVDPAEYMTSDVCVSFEVNEDIILYITYEGPVADEIGIDQLAENIYDLVEVID